MGRAGYIEGYVHTKGEHWIYDNRSIMEANFFNEGKFETLLKEQRGREVNFLDIMGIKEDVPFGKRVNLAYKNLDNATPESLEKYTKELLKDYENDINNFFNEKNMTLKLNKILKKARTSGYAGDFKDKKHISLQDGEVGRVLHNIKTIFEKINLMLVAIHEINKGVFNPDDKNSQEVHKQAQEYKSKLILLSRDLEKIIKQIKIHKGDIKGKKVKPETVDKNIQEVIKGLQGFKKAGLGAIGLLYEELAISYMTAIMNRTKKDFAEVVHTGNLQRFIENVKGEKETRTAKTDFVVKINDVTYGFNVKSSMTKTFKKYGVVLQEGTLEGLLGTVSGKDKKHGLDTLVNYVKLTRISHGYLKGRERKLLRSEIPLVNEVNIKLFKTLILLGLGHSFLDKSEFQGKEATDHINSDFFLLGDSLYSKSQIIRKYLNKAKTMTPRFTVTGARGLQVEGISFDRNKDEMYRYLKRKGDIKKEDEKGVSGQLKEQSFEGMRGSHKSLYNTISKLTVQLKLKLK